MELETLHITVEFYFKCLELGCVLYAQPCVEVTWNCTPPQRELQEGLIFEEGKQEAHSYCANP